jgi:hypothetical protein
VQCIYYTILERRRKAARNSGTVDGLGPALGREDHSALLSHPHGHTSSNSGAAGDALFGSVSSQRSHSQSGTGTQGHGVGSHSGRSGSQSQNAYRTVDEHGRGPAFVVRVHDAPPAAAAADGDDDGGPASSSFGVTAPAPAPSASEDTALAVAAGILRPVSPATAATAASINAAYGGYRLVGDH